MPFNINDFKAEVNNRRGPMRTNKFLVTFPLPAALLNTNVASSGRTLEYWCESVSLPGYLIGTHDVRRWTYGPVEKRPLTPSFTDLQCTFINDNNSTVLNFFQTWQQQILPHEATNGINTLQNGGYVYELNYKVNYATDITIKVYNEAGEKTLDVVCREAFPAQIPDTPFSWADTNNVMRFPVVFHYLDWYYNPR
jgi:hypothetical protein